MHAAAPGWGCSPRARHLCCTTYAELTASSARSDSPMPRRLHDSKHPLTNASPSLERTRTASCTFHSGGASQGSWPPALGGGRHRGGSPTWSGPTTHEASSNATTYPRHRGASSAGNTTPFGSVVLCSIRSTDVASPYPHGIIRSASGSCVKRGRRAPYPTNWIANSSLHHIVKPPALVWTAGRACLLRAFTPASSWRR